MNHSFEPNAAVVGVHDGCIVLEAAQDIEADTERTHSYQLALLTLHQFDLTMVPGQTTSSC